jgi:hypothetical protein
VKAATANLGLVDPPPAITVGAGGKALGWNDLPAQSLPAKCDAAAVKALADVLPDAEALILFWSDHPKEFSELTADGEKLAIEARAW